MSPDSLSTQDASWQMLRRWYAQGTFLNIAMGLAVAGLAVWGLGGDRRSIAAGLMAMVVGSLATLFPLMLGGTQQRQSFALAVLGGGMARMMLAGLIALVAVVALGLSRQPLVLGVGLALLLMLVLETMLAITVLSRVDRAESPKTSVSSALHPGTSHAEPSST
jgi:hypothetical protein